MVSAVSGCRSGLPPTKPLYCAAGFSSMLPYCAAVTPVRAHCVERQRRRRSRAHVDRAVEADRLRTVQLGDVRHTHGALIARPRADVLDRRPLETELVGVGREVEAVVGVAIARLSRHALRERRVLDQRHARFGEEILGDVAAGDRRSRTTLAGTVARLERCVRQQLALLLAPLDADVDEQAASAPSATSRRSSRGHR